MSRIVGAAGLLLAGLSGLALVFPPFAQWLLQLAASAMDTPARDTWLQTARLWFADGILAGVVIAAAGTLLQRPHVLTRLAASRVAAAILVTVAIQGVSMWFRRSAILDAGWLHQRV